MQEMKRAMKNPFDQNLQTASMKQVNVAEKIIPGAVVWRQEEDA
jgi:hypothetical protein